MVTEFEMFTRDTDLGFLVEPLPEITVGGARMGNAGDNWKSFLDFNVQMSQVWAPFLGRLIDVKHASASKSEALEMIMKTDDKTKIQAIQTILSSGALRTGGFNTGTNPKISNSLTTVYYSLPKGERDRLLDAAYQELLSKTADPQMRNLLTQEYNRLKKRRLWEMAKWPLIIGGVVVAVGTVIFIVKRKEFIMGPGGRMRVRA